MSEHPTVRCECGRGAVDVAPDYDPFAKSDVGPFPQPPATWVQAHCAAGHWFYVERVIGEDGDTKLVSAIYRRRGEGSPTR